MPITPYLRPDLDQQENLLPLYITGSLPNATPGAAYRGELQIHNQVGACQVVSVTGSDLPPGGSIFCEGDKLVVAWPAYSEHASEPDNPSFETGDLSGWTFITNGGTGTPEISSSQHYDGSYSLRWPAKKGLGLGGAVELHATNDTIGIANPTQRVTASVRMMYNPARRDYGHGNIQFRGQALLRWLDGNDVEIGISEGRLEKGNAGWYNQWNVISVSGFAPAGTRGVQFVAKLANVVPGGTSDANGGVWMDRMQWNAPQAVGINIETTLCFTITIRDSAGRTAPWSGCVTVANATWDYTWTTVTPNPTGFLTSHNGFHQLSPTETMAIGGSVISSPSSVSSDAFATFATGVGGITYAAAVGYSDELDTSVILQAGGSTGRYRVGGPGNSWAATGSTGTSPYFATGGVVWIPSQPGQPGKFVNYGENGLVSTSPTGQTWTRNTGTSGYDVRQSMWLPEFGRAVLMRSTNIAAATRALYTTDGLALTGVLCNGQSNFAYSPFLGRLVTGCNGSTGVYSVSDNGGLSYYDQTPPSGVNFSSIIWHPVLKEFYMFNFSGNNAMTVYRSATGLTGSWIHVTFFGNDSGATVLGIASTPDGPQIMAVFGVANNWRRSNIIY